MFDLHADAKKSRHLGPGKKWYKGIQIEYFPENFWVFKGYFDL